MCMYATSCIRGIHSACDGSRIFLVFLYKLFERICLACILLDTFHDRLAADGAVVGDIIVHAAGLFRTEYPTAVHESAFVDVHPVAVAVIEYQVAPRYFVHFARQ